MITESNAHLRAVIVARGIRRVISDRYGSMLWTPVRLRKRKTCGLCDGVILAGAYAWCPITFGDWRMQRICSTCWPLGTWRP